jgi:F-type H+-transporting ATPase subunit delta
MKEDIAFNKLIVIAKRYSQALIKLAQSDDELNSLYDNLAAVNETVKSSDDLKTFLSHPAISKDDKKSVLGEIFGGKVPQEVLNFVFILLDRNRIFALGAIINALKEEMNRKYNILVIRAISAVELSSEMKAKLAQKLETIYQKKVNLDTKVDESLIAGMVLKIGDKIIDGSVKSRLESMKRTLIQR